MLKVQGNRDEIWRLACNFFFFCAKRGPDKGNKVYEREREREIHLPSICESHDTVGHFPTERTLTLRISDQSVAQTMTMPQSRATRSQPPGLHPIIYILGAGWTGLNICLTTPRTQTNISTVSQSLQTTTLQRACACLCVRLHQPKSTVVPWDMNASVYENFILRNDMQRFFCLLLRKITQHTKDMK